MYNRKLLTCLLYFFFLYSYALLFGVVKFYGYKEYFLSNAYSNNQFFLILLQKLFQSIIQLNLPLYCAERSERGVGRVVGWAGQTSVTSPQS